MITLSLKELELEPLQRTNRKRWTREDCDFLERVGFLPNRYELLDGEILEKVGQDYPHGVTISRVAFRLMQKWGTDLVITQTTLEVRDSDRRLNRPEPDIYVLNARPKKGIRTPLGTQTLLAVEVSDSTLRDDLLIKAPLYARAGIPELWVMDVNGRKLYVHRQPIDGTYQDLTVYTEEEQVAPLAAPELMIRVADLLVPELEEDEEIEPEETA